MGIFLWSNNIHILNLGSDSLTIKNKYFKICGADRKDFKSLILKSIFILEFFSDVEVQKILPKNSKKGFYLFGEMNYKSERYLYETYKNSCGYVNYIEANSIEECYNIVLNACFYSRQFNNGFFLKSLP